MEYGTIVAILSLFLIEIKCAPQSYHKVSQQKHESKTEEVYSSHGGSLPSMTHSTYMLPHNNDEFSQYGTGSTRNGALQSQSQHDTMQTYDSLSTRYNNYRDQDHRRGSSGYNEFYSSYEPSSLHSSNAHQIGSFMGSDGFNTQSQSSFSEINKHSGTSDRSATYLNSGKLMKLIDTAPQDNMGHSLSTNHEEKFDRSQYGSGISTIKTGQRIPDDYWIESRTSEFNKNKLTMGSLADSDINVRPQTLPHIYTQENTQFNTKRTDENNWQTSFADSDVNVRPQTVSNIYTQDDTKFNEKTAGVNSWKSSLTDSDVDLKLQTIPQIYTHENTQFNTKTAGANSWEISSTDSDINVRPQTVPRIYTQDNAKFHAQPAGVNSWQTSLTDSDKNVGPQTVPHIYIQENTQFNKKTTDANNRQYGFVKSTKEESYKNSNGEGWTTREHEFQPITGDVEKDKLLRQHNIVKTIHTPGNTRELQTASLMEDESKKILNTKEDAMLEFNSNQNLNISPAQVMRTYDSKQSKKMTPISSSWTSWSSWSTWLTEPHGNSQGVKVNSMKNRKRVGSGLLDKDSTINEPQTKTVSSKTDKSLDQLISELESFQHAQPVKTSKKIESASLKKDESFVEHQQENINPTIFDSSKTSQNPYPLNDKTVVHSNEYKRRSYSSPGKLGFTNPADEIIFDTNKEQNNTNFGSLIGQEKYSRNTKTSYAESEMPKLYMGLTESPYNSEYDGNNYGEHLKSESYFKSSNLVQKSTEDHFQPPTPVYNMRMLEEERTPSEIGDLLGNVNKHSISVKKETHNSSSFVESNVNSYRKEISRNSETAAHQRTNNGFNYPNDKSYHSTLGEEKVVKIHDLDYTQPQFGYEKNLERIEETRLNPVFNEGTFIRTKYNQLQKEENSFSGQPIQTELNREITDAEKRKLFIKNDDRLLSTQQKITAHESKAHSKQTLTEFRNHMYGDVSESFDTQQKAGGNNQTPTLNSDINFSQRIKEGNKEIYFKPPVQSYTTFQSQESEPCPYGEITDKSLNVKHRDDNSWSQRAISPSYPTKHERSKRSTGCEISSSKIATTNKPQYSDEEYEQLLVRLQKVIGTALEKNETDSDSVKSTKGVPKEIGTKRITNNYFNEKTDGIEDNDFNVKSRDIEEPFLAKHVYYNGWENSNENIEIPNKYHSQNNQQTASMQHKNSLNYKSQEQTGDAQREFQQVFKNENYFDGDSNEYNQQTRKNKFPEKEIRNNGSRQQTHKPKSSEEIKFLYKKTHDHQEKFNDFGQDTFDFGQYTQDEFPVQYNRTGQQMHNELGQIQQNKSQIHTGQQTVNGFVPDTFLFWLQTEDSEFPTKQIYPSQQTQNEFGHQTQEFPEKYIHTGQEAVNGFGEDAIEFGQYTQDKIPAAKVYIGQPRQNYFGQDNIHFGEQTYDYEFPEKQVHTDQETASNFGQYTQDWLSTKKIYSGQQAENEFGQDAIEFGQQTQEYEFPDKEIYDSEKYKEIIKKFQNIYDFRNVKEKTNQINDKELNEQGKANGEKVEKYKKSKNFNNNLKNKYNKTDSVENNSLEPDEIRSNEETDQLKKTNFWGSFQNQFSNVYNSAKSKVKNVVVKVKDTIS